MGALDRLPVEMLCAILDELTLSDVRNLRLVNRAIGEVASSIAFKDVWFILRKNDFDMVRAIANNPSCAAHTTRLAYLVHMFNHQRETLAQFAQVIRQYEDVHARRYKLRPDLFATPKPKKTDAEIQDYYRRYVRLYEEQEEILSNDHDFALMEEVVSKFPNLRSILVEDDSYFDSTEFRAAGPRFVVRSMVASDDNFDFGDDLTDAYSGVQDDRAAATTRNLRAVLKGVEKAGIQLQSIHTGALQIEILDKKQFGLHSMPPRLLENLTTLNLMLLAVGERTDVEASSGMLEHAPMVAYARSHLARCRALTRRATLRQTLEKMPNLVDLSIELLEMAGRPSKPSWQMPWDLPSPAFLKDVILVDRFWPKLKRLVIKNVETDHPELLAFLVRHKASLETLKLDNIRLTSTSWRSLLPDMKAQFRHSRCIREMVFMGFVLGVEQDTGLVESWYLGNADEAPKNRCPIGRAVIRYLMSDDGEESFPLHIGNMFPDYPHRPFKEDIGDLDEDEDKDDDIE
ncbi:hypothetical protein QBC47DRAFT_431781 [Echria macrotheca]|uniref:F-box domain-containing protein n=1 Tax=Echria macrotheca TaxID=438768 RepID=A0AAJ0B7V7_9PEZI|nr:hypothetical protein QBC47DRAFT_431781 [Echria macrotheca]